MRQSKTVYTNDIQYDYPNEYWNSKIYNRVRNYGFASIVNVGYEVSKKRKISFQYLGNNAFPKTMEEGNTRICSKEEERLVKRLIAVGDAKNKNYHHAFTGSLLTILDTFGKKYTIDVDYFVYASDKKNNQITHAIHGDDIPETLTLLNNNNEQRIENLTTQIDFDLPYAWAKFEFGGKMNWTNTNSQIDITTTQIQKTGDHQRDKYTYRENTQALYFSGAKSWGEKWQVKTGLRAEATQNEGDSFSRNQVNMKQYIKLFPTLYVAYQVNSNHTISLQYSKRIQRPSYGNLNPVRWYLNTTSYEEGNPFLQPALNTNLEFSHSFKNAFNTSLSFTQTKNGFGQLTIHNADHNFQQFIQLNYFSAQIINLNLYASLDFLPGWTNAFEFNTFYTETKSNTTYLKPEYTGLGAYFISTTSLTLNKAKTIAVEIGYEQDFASQYIGTSTSANANVSAGIKLLLLAKKLQCALNANDIFGTDQIQLSNTTQNIFQTFKQYFDTQYLRLSLSYSLGNKNVELKKQRTSNEEEKGRVN
ncbi:outer membrane beta-barrel family protein [Myroides odoratus]|uniref:outer membrane beta-barrel family protein n=1 Tax=Myroides odoratus TaxID=256 RepID=UPI0039AFB6B4